MSFFFQIMQMLVILYFVTLFMQCHELIVLFFTMFSPSNVEVHYHLFVTAFLILNIFSEYMHGGNLYDYLHKQERVLELSVLLKIAIDVCKGMDYLHKNNIIHRDLKTANLLIDRNQVCNSSQ